MCEEVAPNLFIEKWNCLETPPPSRWISPQQRRRFHTSTRTARDVFQNPNGYWRAVMKFNVKIIPWTSLGHIFCLKLSFRDLRSSLMCFCVVPLRSGFLWFYQWVTRMSGWNHRHAHTHAQDTCDAAQSILDFLVTSVHFSHQTTFILSLPWKAEPKGEKPEVCHGHTRCDSVVGFPVR